MTEQATADTGTPKQELYQNAFIARLDQEEEEIKRLDAERAGETSNTQDEAKPEVDDAPEPETSEEKTWKKRYGDLRKHAQEKERELKNSLTDAEKRIERLEQTMRENPSLPQTAEEVAAWRKQNPEAMRIIEAIVREQLEGEREEVDAKLRKLEESNVQAQHREAFEALSKHVEDKWDVSIGELEADEEFHAWVQEQDDAFQDALYDSGVNWQRAARVIDLYFLDNGAASAKKTSRRKKQELDSAVAVETKQATDPAATKKVLYESQVAKWTVDEYERRMDEVSAHIANGTFIMDVTGGAR